MAQKTYKCKYCGKDIVVACDEFEKVGRVYAHTDCIKENNGALEAIETIISECCGYYTNFNLIKKQYKQYISEKKTPEGILNTVRYIRDIKGLPFKDNAMAIVAYNYQEAMEYYARQERAIERANKITDEDRRNVHDPNVNYYVIHPQPIQKPKKVKLFHID